MIVLKTITKKKNIAKPKVVRINKKKIVFVQVLRKLLNCGLFKALFQSPTNNTLKLTK